MRARNRCAADAAAFDFHGAGARGAGACSRREGHGMIWHIFRKDCRLLWPIALGVAGANICYRALFAWLAFSQEIRLAPIVNMLTVLSLMGTAVLITMAVQQ